VRKSYPSYKHIQTHFESKVEKKFEMGKTVKSRLEPCHIIQVAEAIAGIKSVSVETLASHCYENTLKCFF